MPVLARQAAAAPTPLQGSEGACKLEMWKLHPPIKNSDDPNSSSCAHAMPW